MPSASNPLTPPSSSASLAPALFSFPTLIYDADSVEELELCSFQDCIALRDRLPRESFRVVWVHIDRVHQEGILEQLGEIFQFHPLMQEDLVHLAQRPKHEEYNKQIFLVMRSHRYLRKENELEAEQISFVVGENILFSFQERPSDLFDLPRTKIKENKGKIRKRGVDYLAYSLMDVLVDRYRDMIDVFEEQAEELEDAILLKPTQPLLERLHLLRRHLILLRKAMLPTREMIRLLEAAETSFIRESTRYYIRDVYDHIVHAIDSLEGCRELVAGLTELHLTSTSNHLAHVMKIFAMISTIFIPLNLLSSIYGMNFKYMPELHHRWGYFGLLGFMVFLAGSMLLIFRKRGWF